MKFNVIIPCYNKCKGIDGTMESVLGQQHKDLSIYLCLDSVDKELEDEIINKYTTYSRVHCTISYGTRLYALKNLCRVLDDLNEDSIIGIVDCGDHLCRPDVCQLVTDAYCNDIKCVWTAHMWDKNGMNQSCHLNDDLSPYQQRWASSHFRTFLLSYYKKINKKNFLDPEGSYFKRTYDQALMLPIIHLVHQDGFKTKYIDKVCYIYTGNYKPLGEDNLYQLKLENFIKKRGYVE